MNKVVALLILCNVVMNGKSIIEYLANRVQKTKKIFGRKAEEKARKKDELTDIDKAEIADILKAVKEERLAVERESRARVEEKEAILNEERIKYRLQAEREKTNTKAVASIIIELENAMKRVKEARIKAEEANIKTKETRLKLEENTERVKKEMRLRVEAEVEKAIEIEEVKKAKIKEEAEAKEIEEAEKAIRRAEEFKELKPKKARIKKAIAGITGLGVVGGITGLGVLASITNTTHQNTIQNITLTHSDTESTTLSNMQYVSNTTTHTTNNTTVTGVNTALTTPEALVTTHTTSNTTVTGDTALTTPKALVTTQTANSVSNNGHVNNNRTHTSMHKLAVYIAVAIAVVLFITAGIVLIIRKATLNNNNKDLFTDMNQYYTNSTIAAPLSYGSIYPNVSLKQHNYLIN